MYARANTALLERTKESSIKRKKGFSIRRVGKDILFVDDKDAQVLSGDKIKSIIDEVVKAKKPTKILTSGLSKAQVEKIAGSFISSNRSIEVRHVSCQNNVSNKLQRFEIVVKGGEVNVQTEKRNRFVK